MYYRFLLIIIGLLNLSLLNAQDEKLQWPEDLPPAPSYGNIDHWAALPFRIDEADMVPEKSQLKDQQDSALVDVFFVHPTTHTDKKDSTWNGDLRVADLNRRTSTSTIKHQATIFNGSCKVYAPRYRQAHLRSYFVGDTVKRAKQAFEVAYSDVKAAFEYYLEHFNNGRPIIIASHSQGTTHSIRLMKEFFDGKPLADQLVAAYLVGMPVRESDFEELQPCQNGDKTGCYTSWCAYGWKYKTPDWNKGAVVTNPITWTTDSTYAKKKQSAGFVWRHFRKVRPGMVDAQVHDGILWTHMPNIFEKVFVWTKNFHVGDYNLFYMDVRKNVANRVDHYLKKKEEEPNEDK